MHIIHIGSELAPIAKVGGLADVIYGLAKATAKQGHTVEIILPKYDSIDYSLLKNLKPEFRELWSYEGPYRYHNTIWSAELENLKILLLESHHPAYFFSRGDIYGFPDDIDRFVYFSRAVLEYLFKSGKNPDILHLHDWPVSLAAPLYKEMYIPLGFRTKGVVLTIHNLQHQGKCSPSNVTKAGLRGEDYLTEEKMGDPLLPTHLNLLKGGIVYSDFVTTVSPTYEKEIKTQDGGFGLDTLLIKYQKKLKGILNGIDYDYWNPATDKHISPYSTQNVLQGKKENKLKVRKKFGLKESKGPLVCAISRLVPQKGPALIIYALKKTVEKGGQFILLGTAPDPNIDVAFKNLQQELIPNKDVIIHLDYNETLAHLTYAASDMIIIPSLFEPCGLTQMIALRYGTLPIVRKTGGLADTVIDIDHDHGNGFVFDFPDIKGVDWALDRAFNFYKKGIHLNLIEQSMQVDFSWNRSADEYMNIYENASRSQK
jgi:starch synthase